MKDEILNHWQIQESLLQSYRGLLLTSQSIILAIAAIVVTNQTQNVTILIIFIPLLILGVYLLLLWFEIGVNRGFDVSYFQMLLLKTENGESVNNVMTNFKEWQKKGAKEKKGILAKYGLPISQTRNKLGLYVPRLFVILWITLTVVVILRLTNAIS